jgi:two-component system KDP operon response regulator KdpE
MPATVPNVHDTLTCPFASVVSCVAETLPDPAPAVTLTVTPAVTRVPIIALFARRTDRDAVQLLNGGADDCMGKPFSTPELVARVQALLRRARLYQSPAPDRVEIGHLTLDLARRVATRAGSLVRLTPLEWHLLRVLALNAGRTLTHQQLFHAVWGNAFGDAQQNLRVHITHLRRKIETIPSAPSIIVTEPGVGYRCEIGTRRSTAGPPASARDDSSMNARATG